MKKKFSNQYLDSIDWEKFLERDMELFIADLFAQLYNEPLRKATGFGFKKLLVFYKNGNGTWYQSKSETDECKKYFTRLIENNDPRIASWIEKEKETHTLAEKIGSIEDIDEMINTLLEIMIYNTEIPFRLLYPMEDMEGHEELRKSLEKIRLKAFWTDIMENVFGKLYDEISEKHGITKEQASLLRPTELIDLIKHGKMVPIEELEKRNRGCYFYYFDNKINYIFTEDDVLLDIDKNLKECKGVTAFKGKVKGTVKVVNSIKQLEKFEDGDILVSINTSPSIMPAIQRASAIVSDEGGITSHAAIVSRELKIPCIVGTKVATKVFKDGDTVEVDADKGIARKIR